ncbi:hypothetical protein AWB77_04655 [Caballeronia fortuita]|uniref:Secreted protein n=1 Tax=Caballeronia fortuita TaxID=1777138 RepID=A0A158CYX3_9BURK|nr:hypothetical protein [Caballeronia fortuita]SAK86817.1 hypothetical protein AWB77_04655 [Caballeronia fortuita]
MNKAKLLASAWAILATLGTAHAQQVMGAKCAGENNGAFDETASHQAVICANAKWQDATTAPLATVNVEKYSDAKALEASYATKDVIGRWRVQQSNDGHRQFTLVANVVALNSDNTAHVVVDLEDSGWQQHVDTTVPLNAATAIATDNRGAEYRITVKRTPA